MKALMVESLKTLIEAHEKYNLAQLTFQNLNSSIKKQNVMLEKMLDESTEDYDAFRARIEKNSFYCQIIDIFSYGLCTPIYEAITGPKLEEYTIMMEKLRGITSRMMKSGEHFDKTIEDAMAILNSEIALIDNWTNSAEIVKMNIDKYPKEYLKKYESVRTAFVIGLDDLQKSAEEFLARPVEIL